MISKKLCEGRRLVGRKGGERVIYLVAGGKWGGDDGNVRDERSQCTKFELNILEVNSN